MGRVDLTELLFILIILTMLIGLPSITAGIARKKGYNYNYWWRYGFFFSVIALNKLPPTLSVVLKKDFVLIIP